MRLHAKRDSIVYSHGWSNGRRRWKRHFLAIRQLIGNDGIFFFLSIKENDDFRIISRRKLQGSVSSSPRDRSTKFIRRSSDVGSLSFGLKIAMRTRGGSSLGTIDGKAKLPIYRRWCVLPSLLSPHFTFRIFYPSFSSIRRENMSRSHRILEHANCDVIVNVNAFVEIRGYRVKSEERK